MGIDALEEFGEPFALGMADLPAGGHPLPSRLLPLAQSAMAAMAGMFSKFALSQLCPPRPSFVASRAVI